MTRRFGVGTIQLGFRVLVGVCFLMLAVATSDGQEDSFALSAPANPWTAEPVEVDATLLLLPWEVDGRFHEDGDVLATEIQKCFQAARIRNVEVSRKEEPWRHLYSMRHYDKEDGIPVNPEHIEVLVRYFRASHVLSGTLEDDEDNNVWRYSARLDGSALPEPITRDFEMERGNINQLSAEVAHWIGLAMGDILTSEELEALGKPTLPARVKGPNDPLFETLSRNPASSSFDDLIAMHPDHPRLALQRARMLRENLHREKMEALAADALPAGSHPFHHAARAILLARIDYRAALHEWEILAAQYPGIQEYPRMLRDFPVYIDADPDDAIRRMERWHNRAPTSPHNEYYLAMKIQAVSRHLRGDGFAHTIPQEHRRKIRAYSDYAVELTLSIFEESGHLPHISYWVMDATALVGDPELMFQIFRDTISKYPYHGPLYGRYLQYIAPRWFGSEDMMVAFIEQTLDRYPDWNYPAALPLGRLWSEASLSVSDFRNEDVPDIIHEWLQRRPKWRAVLYKSIDHALGSDMTAESASWAFIYAHHLRDEDAMTRVIKEYPMLIVRFHLPRIQWLTNEIAGKPFAKHNFELGNYEACITAVGSYRTSRRSSASLPISTGPDDEWTPYMAAAEAFTNRLKESDRLWAEVHPDNPLQPLRLISWAAANHRVDEVLAEVEPLAREKPDDLQLVGAYAIALAQSGERERAREVLATVPLFEQGDRWTYLKDAARRVVLGEE